MNKSRRMRWAGYVKRMAVNMILVGKPKGKRRREGQRRGWVDNIKMDYGTK
jgi:hypothetical protein